jgi:hypothetical protein
MRLQALCDTDDGREAAHVPSVVRHDETLMRMARPCQTVGPHQDVPFLNSCDDGAVR